MNVKNLFMANWSGEYSWTIKVPGINLQLLELAEKNVSMIPNAEGFNCSGQLLSNTGIIIMTCRINCSSEKILRPGLIFHHAIIIEPQLFSKINIDKLFQKKYPDPVNFTKELYRKIESNLPTANKHTIINSVKTMLSKSTIVYSDLFVEPGKKAQKRNDMNMILLYSAFGLLIVTCTVLEIYNALVLQLVCNRTVALEEKVNTISKQNDTLNSILKHIYFKVETTGTIRGKNQDLFEYKNYNSKNNSLITINNSEMVQAKSNQNNNSIEALDNSVNQKIQKSSNYNSLTELSTPEKKLNRNKRRVSENVDTLKITSLKQNPNDTKKKEQ